MMPQASKKEALKLVEGEAQEEQALKVKTFSNIEGGNGVFKALSHPLAARKAVALLAKLARGPVAIYDPNGYASDFAAFYDVSGIEITDVFVQNLKDIGKTILGKKARPVNEMGGTKATTVFVAAFDAERPLEQVRHFLPQGANITTLDEIRLPEELVTNKRNYLDLLNFATNYALFRDAKGEHTRIITANYWNNYGAKSVTLWCCLFDEKGNVLVEWKEPMATGQHLIALDSAEVRARFKLGEFTGSLFIHAVGAAGHDIVKYALDTYGDDAHVLSCTHDANSWPADFYAGIPAPRADEKVILWIENSSPHPIPAGAVGLNLMGSRDVVRKNPEIGAFASYALDVSEWLPKARWPEQLEVHAGRYFVRPRYEVLSKNGHKRIAHANVERTDLKPDAEIPNLAARMGKGFLLPAPILPTDRFTTVALPTPMATGQENLPLALILYDASGKEVLRQSLGKLERRDSVPLDVNAILKKAGKTLESGFGHVELVYDFSNGGTADGWLHGLFRYEEASSGHAAETSFGAHIFNTALVYKNEPQSYAGKAPGLSTRLFLRLGFNGLDAHCHLIYPASTPWHATSSTDLILHNAKGDEVSRKQVKIPCSGSLFWRYSEMFSAAERASAGENAYVIIRDVTCRLFGYHGLSRDGSAFSLDHMFGF